MSLIEFQTALGRLVRTPNLDGALDDVRLDATERAYFARLQSSAGFRFTREVQRSWCVGRAARAAQLTFSTLSPIGRRILLEEWVDLGGGSGSFDGAEADALLEFIAERLPAPSHELSVCRLEQLTLRAIAGAQSFRAPAGGPPDWVGRGRYADIVTFYGEPHMILARLGAGRRLPLARPRNYLFAPGLDGFYRSASARECAVWSHLALPTRVTNGTVAGCSREMLRRVLGVGALEPADGASSRMTKTPAHRNSYAEIVANRTS